MDNIINDIDETNDQQEDEKINVEEDDTQNSIEEEEQVGLLDRPRPENAGTGIEQIQTSFQNTEYGF